MDIGQRTQPLDDGAEERPERRQGL